MKKLLVLIVFLSFNILAITAQKFKPGVAIVKIEKNENYQIPNSILIEFTGHTHSIYFYADLAKKLKRRFKRGSIQVNFNYKLRANNPLQGDLNLIPKEKYSVTDFEVVCKINLPKYENLGGKFEFSKLNLMLNVSVFKNRKEQLKSILKVNTYKTIVTQNRKVSKTIVALITGNN